MRRCALAAATLAVALAACASGPTHAARTPPPPTTARLAPAPPSTRPGTRPTLIPLKVETPSHQGDYDRAVDFGGWKDIDGCRNTRAEVLMHTSAIAVTYTSRAGCTVRTGRWTDPWSGTTTSLARAFQIDHTVPLGNAWSSGAWAWSGAQRVAYANDLADTDHLVPIVASENEAKGDHGPEQWRPPNRSAWCRYSFDWDHIKAKWHLTATSAEWAAVVQMAATC